MDKNKVIEKIQKLMKITEENGASQAEVIKASATASKLLVKYNLSLTDVEDKDENIIELSTVIKHRQSSGSLAVNVASLLSEFSGCKSLFQKINQTSTVVIFIGKEMDINVCLCILNANMKFAESSMKTAWSKHWKSIMVEAKKHIPEKLSLKDLRKYGLVCSQNDFEKSFLHGYLVTFYGKLKEIKKEVKDEEQDSSGAAESKYDLMVMSSSEAVQEYVDQNIKVSGTIKYKPSVKSQEGYIDGAKTGENAPINKSIS